MAGFVGPCVSVQTVQASRSSEYFLLGGAARRLNDFVEAQARVGHGGRYCELGGVVSGRVSGHTWKLGGGGSGTKTISLHSIRQFVEGAAHEAESGGGFPRTTTA